MTEQEFYERIEGLCYNIPNRLETPITSAREIVSEFKAYADAQVAEKDAEISRLEAENERLREGIERVVASNSSHPWSAIDREDLIEDVHQMNAVLKSLLSPAPENPEVDEFPCPNCMNTPSGKVACLYNCKIKGQ